MTAEVVDIVKWRLLRLTGPAALAVTLKRIKRPSAIPVLESVSRAVDYYRDKLGFDVDLYDTLPEHYGFAQRDSCGIHFAFWKGVSPSPNSKAVPPDMFDLYVYVEDVEGLYDELVDRGAEIVHGPVDQGYGTHEFRVRDPHGYILAFGRQLVGTSEPTC